MVLDQRKAHVWVQKHAVRCDVFGTLNSRWQIKAHVMLKNAYLKLNPAMRGTVGFKPRIFTSSVAGWYWVIFHTYENALNLCQ
jgi:hypothetical protein